MAGLDPAIRPRSSVRGLAGLDPMRIRISGWGREYFFARREPVRFMAGMHIIASPTWDSWSELSTRFAADRTLDDLAEVFHGS